MKYETLKQKVARAVHTRILSMDPTDADYAARTVDRIENWDVRCIGALRKQFLNEFPPTLRHGRLIAYVANNRNGDWMVERAR